MQLWISRTMSLQNWEMRLVNWRTVRSWQKMVLRKSVNKKCWEVTELQNYVESTQKIYAKLIELKECPRTNKLQIEKTEEIENETWNECNGRGTEISLNIFVYCLSKLLIEFPSHCFFLIQSALRINMKPLFRSLLVLTN